MHCEAGLQGADLRQKDRSDLGRVALPEVNKLRDFAEENIQNSSLLGGAVLPSPHHSHISSARIKTNSLH